MREARNSGYRYAERGIRLGTTQHTGDLTLTDQARTANWFFNNIEGAKTNVSEWLGRPPIAHAHTILVASRKPYLHQSTDIADGSDSPENKEAALWKAAWNYLMTAHYLPAADVDLECLTALEERMFERSNRAGASGNWQWGLDVGEHQDRWNPYNGLPTHWNFDDRDQHESELEVCGLECFSVSSSNFFVISRVVISAAVAMANKVLKKQPQQQTHLSPKTDLVRGQPTSLSSRCLHPTIAKLKIL
jgi:hypothetical protein